MSSTSAASLPLAHTSQSSLSSVRTNRLLTSPPVSRTRFSAHRSKLAPSTNRE